MSAALETAPLAWLQTQLCRNRFLPAPPEDLAFCGDGDFRAIGAEFLGHFVCRCDLQPDERVLDLGCGIGRMAVPLTQYLSEDGSYMGVDVVRQGIDWCNASIASAYPNFQFRHLDLHHPIYNAAGTTSAATVRLPFEDNSFDVILLVSVLTHLDAASLTNYAREVRRLLAPGGRCFATAFLVNPPAREAARSGANRLGFDPDAPGPEIHVNPESPMAAVAYDEDFLLEKFLRFGLRRARTAVYGCWSGRPSAVFQDICIFE